MTFGWIALALIYLTLLFYIASWGDKDTPLARRITSHPMVYSLALAIYCTAWTFLGSVGQASRDQWAYLPILLGPVLVYVFGYKFIYKMTLVSKKLHINTIADFIASRYGKRQTVALVVTLLALLATIPYIALQIKAIGSTFMVLTHSENGELIAMVATIGMALFAMFFGTRQTDVTEYRRGLILAVAFESCLKLFALVCIAFVGYLTWQSQHTGPILANFVTQEAVSQFSSSNFIAQTIMAAAAVICLPRQFHIAIVDNLDLGHLKTARWLFPLYLIAIATVIPIIAATGDAIFAGKAIEPDTYVIALAEYADSLFLQVLVFVGGLSAATAMIIVATLTLSTMLTNDVILPRFLTSNRRVKGGDLGRNIRLIRRIVIGFILLFAFIYYEQLANTRSLHSIGLIAFSLVIQLLPAIIGGLYWKRGHAQGVYAGLFAGLVVWFSWLVLPLIIEAEPGMQQRMLLSQGAMLSLVVNTVFYVAFSYFAQPRLIDRLQAAAFVSPNETRTAAFKKSPGVNVTAGDLVTLLSTFMGTGRCEQLIAEFERNNSYSLNKENEPDPAFLAFCERALGGVIGAASAKTLIDSVLKSKKLDFTDVISFFDDTAQTVQQNMTALITSLENIDQGIIVIDKNLELVAWNKQYAALYQYPDNLLSTGTPVEKLIRHNATNGEFGPGPVEEHVEKRMKHLHAGNHHRFTRQRADGRVVEMVGNPLPGGGFVASFTDITSYMEVQKALEEAKIDLEHRVKKRTEEVHSINAELRLEIEKRKDVEAELIRAREAAEFANDSKTRFLALASHDILQPLNAAKLYASSLIETPLDPATHTTVEKLSQSLNASETLIGTLLDIARLDQGRMQPSIEPVNLKDLLQPLLHEFAIRANEKGLVFKARLHELSVSSDSTYLYRIVLNLLSNAVKYTPKGKVVFSVRRRKNQAHFCILDTGVGLTDEEQSQIFDDFYRCDSQGETGVGLGLGVVKRFCVQLGIKLRMQSEKGKGTSFQFDLPITQGVAKPIRSAISSTKAFEQFDILCVDDQRENLDALETLLTKWGIDIALASSTQEALDTVDNFKPNLLIVDYYLSPEENGIDLANAVREKLGINIPAIMVTASQEEDLKSRCEEATIHLLHKPLKPAKLRALLQRLSVASR